MEEQFSPPIDKPKSNLPQYLVAALAITLMLGMPPLNLYVKDRRARQEFTIAYKNFDNKIAVYYLKKNELSKHEAYDAYCILRFKQQFTSWSKFFDHGAVIRYANEVVDDSKQEMFSLAHYIWAIEHKSADTSRLLDEYNDWTRIRRVAYGQYADLAGVDK